MVEKTLTTEFSIAGSLGVVAGTAVAVASGVLVGGSGCAPDAVTPIISAGRQHASTRLSESMLPLQRVTGR